MNILWTTPITMDPTPRLLVTLGWLLTSHSASVQGFHLPSISPPSTLLLLIPTRNVCGGFFLDLYPWTVM